MTNEKEKKLLPLFVMRADRIGKYLHPYMDQLVFDEFSQGFLERHGLAELLSGVPVPMRPQDVVDFHSGKGLKVLNIARAMAWVMGIDPKFVHNESYLAYMNKSFNDKFPGALVSEGRELVEAGKAEEAVILFRAALMLDPSSLPAMMSYAVACRSLYQAQEGEDQKYVGCFKAESMEYLELVTVVHPEFKESYYYLGYAYLNLGLYTKASLTWKQFVNRSEDSDEKKEIEERIAQLEDPTIIENGINHITAGRYTDGVNVLVPYLKTQYVKWWPLSFYLGVGYSRLGQAAEAKERFLKALELFPSHRDSMEELALIYEAEGDLEKAEKYKKKMDLITQ